jgi:hypothetical protein
VIFTHGARLDVHKRTVMAYCVTVDSTGQQVEGAWKRKHWAKRITPELTGRMCFGDLLEHTGYT